MVERRELNQQPTNPNSDPPASGRVTVETPREICRLGNFHHCVERWRPRANTCPGKSSWHHAGALDERDGWQFGKLLQSRRVCGWYRGRGCTVWDRFLCCMHFQTSGCLPALRDLIYPTDLWIAWRCKRIVIISQRDKHHWTHATRLALRCRVMRSIGNLRAAS